MHLSQKSSEHNYKPYEHWYKRENGKLLKEISQSQAYRQVRKDV